MRFWDILWKCALAQLLEVLGQHEDKSTFTTYLFLTTNYVRRDKWTNIPPLAGLGPNENHKPYDSHRNWFSFVLYVRFLFGKILFGCNETFTIWAKFFGVSAAVKKNCLRIPQDRRTNLYSKQNLNVHAAVSHKLISGISKAYQTKASTAQEKSAKSETVLELGRATMATTKD